MGCLGAAAVSRASILAYFQDPKEIELGGHRYPVEGYREHECIIDPSTIKRITYERVESRQRIGRMIASNGNSGPSTHVKDRRPETSTTSDGATPL